MSYDATKVKEFLEGRIDAQGRITLTLAEVQMLEALVESLRATAGK